MAEDLRLSVGFWHHPKTIKLQRTFGAEGVLALLRLWTWTAQNRTDGVLQGLDAEDIEIVAGWQGDLGRFADGLKSLRWLDWSDDMDAYVVHGWKEHQPWVSGADARKEKARTAANARWARERKFDEQCSDDARSIVEQCGEHTQAMPSSFPFPSLPKSREKSARPLTLSANAKTPLLVPPRRDPDPEDPDLVAMPEARDTEYLPANAPMGNAERQNRAMAWPPESNFRDPAMFEAFWAAYPWKIGKRAAFAAWQRIDGECRNVTPMRIIDALKAQLASGHHFDGLDGKPAIPAPKKWLDDGRWDDVVRGSPGDSVNPTAGMSFRQKLQWAREKK